MWPIESFECICRYCDWVRISADTALSNGHEGAPWHRCYVQTAKMLSLTSASDRSEYCL